MKNNRPPKNEATAPAIEPPILIGPYFEWLFMPLLAATNPFVIAVITGIYLSFVLNGGVSVIEQYIQRASITNNFEF
ncbi:MFS transporter, partial [Weissella soli]|uniref:MFS transporter n=1 Tax=Weissella soli TaxID=155866 RepID=UPI0035A19333